MSNTAIGFLGVYALGLVLALVRHPIFGLLAYLWAFYMHPPQRWWGMGLPDLRWSLLAAAVTLIATFRMPTSGRPAWHTNWGARLLLGYAVWMWIQSSWAVHDAYHFAGCILFTKYVVLYYLIYRTLSTVETLELFALGHIVGCFIFGWLAYGMEVYGRLDAIGGPGIDDANLLALHQITGLVFAGFMFLGQSGLKRWLAFATIPFILNSVILTISRSAFLGLLGAGVAAVYLSPRSRRWLVCGAMALGLLLFLRLTHDIFWERMHTLLTTTESEMEFSARSRVEIVRYGWQMAQDYPWGAGHRGHEVLSPYYIPAVLLSTTAEEEPRRAAHNTFMAALVEQGYPGALWYVALQLYMVIALRRVKSGCRPDESSLLPFFKAALGTALVACFISGQFVNLLKAEVQIWLIALLDVLYVSCTETQTASGEAPRVAPASLARRWSSTERASIVHDS